MPLEMLVGLLSTSKAIGLTISVRVDVRYEREVRTITRLKEYGHDRNEADHLAEVVGIHLSNDDAHYTRHNADEVDPELLCPEAYAKLQDETGRRKFFFPHFQSP